MANQPTKDSFIVYRSFFDAIEPLSDADQLALLKQIFEFGLNHIELDLEPLPRAMFSLIKPQLEANHKRWISGNKGGRPKTSEDVKRTKGKPNNNQTITKPEPNKNKNVNKNNNANVNKNNNIDEFVPNNASLITVNSVYPNCDVNSLVDNFKDQARNRAKPFKDLQSGFRNYVNKGWVKPATKQKTELSYSEIGQILKQERESLEDGKVPSGQIMNLTNKMRIM
jgi:hypothetical protein